MHTSLFDLFKIGIGPSSSHTVGPMRAAFRFLLGLSNAGLLSKTSRVRAELYGSLALTGKGHGTDRGILLGLMGQEPDTVNPAFIEQQIQQVTDHGRLRLYGLKEVPFEADTIVFHKDKLLPGHSNGMRFTALDESGCTLSTKVYYSIGGGFITEEGEKASALRRAPVPYPFKSAADLLRIAKEHDLPIHLIMLSNETAWRPVKETRGGICRIWKVMAECIERGLETEGELPGGLKVRRRARDMARKLQNAKPHDALQVMDWLNVWAIAVNEENAAGGRVVTAPTNGAAGIIPAVAQYYLRFMDGTDEGLQRFFLTAAAIGVLYKENASISGAEVGCQGEVGVACSMAAGALCSASEATNEQIEHAAEIAMEHHLGLTCDPVGGLVQIPCIERNAVGAAKAVNAARMAILFDDHKVSLDQVIRTMYQTGLDMQTRYKETALGGLALNVIEC
jgi:L-serine dehydratase